LWKKLKVGREIQKNPPDNSSNIFHCWRKFCRHFWIGEPVSNSFWFCSSILEPNFDLYWRGI